MPTLSSSQASLYYEKVGSGPPLVLLHPFPLDHEFWNGIAPQLSSGYRLLLPDLRAHGNSDMGDGPVTMQKLADDLTRLCREENVGRATFVGVSIGGYALFEFWRRCREQIGALVLANTRAAAETAEAKAARLQTIEKIQREGTAGFIADMLPKQLSPSTLSNRPDIVDAARRMMQKMSPADVIAVQQGIAARPDSIHTLAGITVPVLVIAGADDSVPLPEMELIHQRIPGSRMLVIPRAGHYAALEQPGDFGIALRKFLDQLPR